MTNNAKIAAYFNIPYCEHDWSGVEVVDDDGEQMELTKCVHCHAYEKGIWDEPIDFATDSGFFVLLNELRIKQISVSALSDITGFRVMFSAWNPNHAGMITRGRSDTDIKTALIAATLEFIERTK